MKSLLLSSVLIPAWLASGCSRPGAPAATSQLPIQAQLVRSVSATEPQSISTTGTIQAKETAIISARLPGQIRQVLVQAGDRVRAGQLLVLLDDEAMRSALDQANAAEESASRQQMAAQSDASLAAGTLARYQMLKNEDSVSPQEFDEVQKRSQAAQLRLESYAAQTQQAKAAVAGARTQLGYTALRAPFAGIVTARLADAGTLAAPGVPLLQVDRDGPLQVVTTVDESLIASVHPGMTTPIAIVGATGTISGTVAQIVPAADPSSRSFQVKLDLPAAKNLRAGMFAAAEFAGPSRQVILAPQTAVIMRGSLACVYALAADNVAQLRFVALGSTHGDQVEILSGLAAGEVLVNRPGDRDLAGKRIESANGAQP
jgi:RND family efflux transporter MFP subunit